MEKIYRYRTFGKDWSLDDLKNETITGVTNDQMNDPYDCHFYFDFNEVKSYIQRNNFCERIKKCSRNNEIQKLDLNGLIKHIANHLEQCIERAFFTTCFTKSNNKEIMWAHYSNNATGYVLEYDFDEIKEKVKILKENDPFDAIKFDKVNYTKEKSDFTGFVINYIDNLMTQPYNKFLDILDIPVFYCDSNRKTVSISKDIVFEKNEDWSYEEEYRLVIPNSQHDGYNLTSTHNTSISDIKATAVYIGEKCSSKDEKEIIDIAKSKVIKVYKMKSNYFNKKYFLDCDEIL